MSSSLLRASGRLASAGLLALGALLGCDPDAPCDPGDYEEHGACYPLPSDAGSGPGSDASDDDDAGGEDAAADDASGPPPGDPFVGYGDTCEGASDCPSWLVCGAPDLPYCTRTNCMGVADACPPDWTCFDTTGVSPDPSVTSICLNL